MTLEDCGRLGSLAAAEVISHIGARPEVSLSKLAHDHGLLD
jgi:sugar/nucleoside kinase (ribokinase family)